MRTKSRVRLKRDHYYNGVLKHREQVIDVPSGVAAWLVQMRRAVHVGKPRKKSDAKGRPAGR